MILGTSEQKAFLENPATPVNAQTVQYAGLVGASSSTALNGVPGSSTFASSGATLPLGFVPLTNLIGNYPVKEDTSIWGLRLDHKITDMQQLLLRVSVSPSLVTGLENSLDGQVPGQGSYSRTDQQQYHDWSIAASHMWVHSVSLFNEARFQFARRGLGFDAAQAARFTGRWRGHPWLCVLRTGYPRRTCIAWKSATSLRIRPPGPPATTPLSSAATSAIFP